MPTMRRFCERNHYDRVAHFVVGVNAVGIAEIQWQKRLLFSLAAVCVFVGVLTAAFSPPQPTPAARGALSPAAHQPL